MIDNLHKVQFYESRSTVQHRNSDPCRSPHTELRSVPEAAVVRYENGVTQEIHPDLLPDDFEKSYDAAQFFIGRAMIDPDAVVVPT